MKNMDRECACKNKVAFIFFISLCGPFAITVFSLYVPNDSKITILL